MLVGTQFAKGNCFLPLRLHWSAGLQVRSATNALLNFGPRFSAILPSMVTQFWLLTSRYQPCFPRHYSSSTQNELSVVQTLNSAPSPARARARERGAEGGVWDASS